MKKHLLILSLCAPIMINTQPNNTDFFTELFNFLFGDQENNTHTPLNVTPEEYCAQLYHDLNGIPEKDRQNILHAVKQELNFYNNGIDTDKATQITKSIIIEHAGNIAEQEARKYLNNQNDIHKIKDSQKNNVRVRLEKINHINGQSIAQFFGQSVRESIKNTVNHSEYKSHLKNRDHNNYHAPRRQQNPTQSYNHNRPPASHSAQSLNAYSYQKICDRDEEVLKKAEMSENMMRQYKQAFWNSQNGCSQEEYTTEEGITRCSKCKIKNVLQAALTNAKNTLYSKVHNKHNLQEAANTTRAMIDSNLPDDASAINHRQLIKYNDNNLEETLVTNMGISCSICYEYYKNEINNGQAGNKVTIPCGNNHHVCTHCATLIHECPECRAKFSSNAMQNNIHHAEQQR